MPFSFEGQLYEFDHLEPFHIKIDSEKAKRELRIQVTFSNHCFSYTRIDEPWSTVLDKNESRPRVFCPTRYRLSLQLPDIIQRLNDPSIKVHQTWHRRNWVYSMKIEDPSGPYHVFFEIKKSPKHKSKYQELSLHVESAYHEDEGRAPNVVGTMKFHILCNNTYLGRKVSTKK